MPRTRRSASGRRATWSRSTDSGATPRSTRIAWRGCAPRGRTSAASVPERCISTSWASPTSPRAPAWTLPSDATCAGWRRSRRRTTPTTSSGTTTTSPQRPEGSRPTESACAQAEVGYTEADQPEGPSWTKEAGDHGEGSRFERQERQAIRGPAQEGHEQVACGRYLELARLIEQRRQEQRLQPEQPQQRTRQRRQPGAEEGGRPQGRQEVQLADRGEADDGDSETAPGGAQERQEGPDGSASEEVDHEAAQADAQRARPRGGQGRRAQARGLEGHRERRRGDDRDRASARGRQAWDRRPFQDGKGPPDPGRRPEATLPLVLRRRASRRPGPARPRAAPTRPFAMPSTSREAAL